MGGRPVTEIGQLEGWIDAGGRKVLGTVEIK